MTYWGKNGRHVSNVKIHQPYSLLCWLCWFIRYKILFIGRFSSESGIDAQFVDNWRRKKIIINKYWEILVTRKFTAAFLLGNSSCEDWDSLNFQKMQFLSKVSITAARPKINAWKMSNASEAPVTYVMSQLWLRGRQWKLPIWQIENSNTVYSLKPRRQFRG